MPSLGHRAPRRQRSRKALASRLRMDRCRRPRRARAKNSSQMLAGEGNLPGRGRAAIRAANSSAGGASTCASAFPSWENCFSEDDA